MYENEVNILIKASGALVPVTISFGAGAPIRMHASCLPNECPQHWNSQDHDITVDEIVGQGVASLMRAREYGQDTQQVRGVWATRTQQAHGQQPARVC